MYDRIMVWLKSLFAKKTIPVPIVIPTPPAPVIHSIAWCGGDLTERQAMFSLAQTVAKNMILGSEITEEFLATIWGESGFNQWCENQNKNSKGEVVSTDFGIAQLNDYWYLKPLGMTGEEAIADPQRCLTVMATAFKNGRADDWCAHKNGGYLKFMGKTL